MAKTYVPGLRFVLNTAYNYMSRWQSRLAPNLTSEQLECFTSTLAAILACIKLLGPSTEGD